MKLKITSLYIFFLIIGIRLFSQNPLSLQDAIKIGFENNYDIQIATSEMEIAGLNNSSGNAGMLPKISANLNESFQSNDFYQKLATGTETNRQGAINSNTNGFIGLNYTFFDGGKMFITKKKLELLEKASKLDLEIQLINLEARISNQYFICKNLLNNIESFQKTLIYAQERLSITKLRLESGLISKSDYLLAQIDNNIILNSLTNLETNYTLQINELKRIINAPSTSTYQLTTNDFMDSTIVNNIQKEMLETSSAEIEKQKLNIEISKQIIQEYKSFYYPSANTQIGYNYGRTQSQAGFLLLSRQNGPSALFGITIPIFNGGNTRRAINVAKIYYKESELILNRLKRDRLSNFESQMALVASLKKQLALQISNGELATENVSIVSARFKQGISTTLESKEAEKNLQNTLQLINDNKLNFYKSMIELKRLVKISGR